MKYIMLEIDHGGCRQKFPVIFPNVLVHEVVSKAMQGVMAEHGLKESTAVSAGSVTFDCNSVDAIHCFGESTTLKISAAKEDARVIQKHDVRHGLS